MRNAPSKILNNFIWIFILVCPVFSHAAIDTYPAFSTNGFLSKDGTLLVSEEFIFDYGDKPRHGIFRTLPLVSDNGKRWYEIKSLEVKNQNKQDIEFLPEMTGNNAAVKIGSQDITLTGTHYYNVRYSVSNIGSDTELNWRAINASGEPIGKFEAKVYFPVLMSKDVATATCSFYPDSQNNLCTINPIIKGDRLLGYVLYTENLKGQEVRINIKYPRGVVLSSYVEKDPTIHYEKYLKIIIPLLALVAIVFFTYRNRYKIKDGYKYLKKHAISPDTYSYLDRAMYYNGEIKKEDIVATVADLSLRGYISLEQFAHPLGANEFIDYAITIISDENDNESEKILITAFQNVSSFAEWLNRNYDEIKPKLEEVSRENVKDIKLYKRDTEEIPSLIGFKIL